MTLDWHYSDGYVNVNIPDYVDKALQKFQHPEPERPQYAPHKWNRPAYGKQTQYAPEPDTTTRLDTKGQKKI